MTTDIPLSVADKIERIRLYNSGVVQDIDWLCDMALATARREEAAPELAEGVEGLVKREELEALVRDATPGPWEWLQSGRDLWSRAARMTLISGGYLWNATSHDRRLMELAPQIAATALHYIAALAREQAEIADLIHDIQRAQANLASERAARERAEKNTADYWRLLRERTEALDALTVGGSLAADLANAREQRDECMEEKEAAEATADALKRAVEGEIECLEHRAKRQGERSTELEAEGREADAETCAAISNECLDTAAFLRRALTAAQGDTTARPEGEAQCDCFGDLGLHASTHGGADGRRYCDMCGKPVRGESADALTAINSPAPSSEGHSAGEGGDDACPKCGVSWFDHMGKCDEGALAAQQAKRDADESFARHKDAIAATLRPDLLREAMGALQKAGCSGCQSWDDLHQTRALIAKLKAAIGVHEQTGEG